MAKGAGKSSAKSETKTSGPASKDDFASAAKAITYVMTSLAAIDSGKNAAFDFVSTGDVDRFCKAVGIKKSWAGKTIDAIAPKSTALDTNAVNPGDAKIILDILSKMIAAGQFTSRDGSKFDRTILNDFMKKSAKGFAGAPTLGHFWEWQYALAVELEHGRTRGTNVTNNHPLLTGLVVMAHLSEDTVYYARLACMELEGELFNAIRTKQPAKDIADMAKRLQLARIYLSRRLNEKMAETEDLPD